MTLAPCRSGMNILTYYKEMDSLIRNPVGVYGIAATLVQYIGFSRGPTGIMLELKNIHKVVSTWFQSVDSTSE